MMLGQTGPEDHTCLLWKLPENPCGGTSRSICWPFMTNSTQPKGQTCWRRSPRSTLRNWTAWFARRCSGGSGAPCPRTSPPCRCCPPYRDRCPKQRPKPCPLRCQARGPPRRIWRRPMGRRGGGARGWSPPGGWLHWSWPGGMPRAWALPGRRAACRPRRSGASRCTRCLPNRSWLLPGATDRPCRGTS